MRNGALASISRLTALALVVTAGPMLAAEVEAPSPVSREVTAREWLSRQFPVRWRPVIVGANGSSLAPMTPTQPFAVLDAPAPVLVPRMPVQLISPDPAPRMPVHLVTIHRPNPRPVRPR